MAGVRRFLLVFVLVNAVFQCTSRSIVKNRLKKRNSRGNRIGELLDCLLKDKQCSRVYQRLSERQNAEGEPAANTVYLNGKVYTVDLNRDWPNEKQEALVIDKDGKIIFIGSDNDAEQYINEKSTVYDLYGATMFPGFHDIHMHPLEARSEVGGTCKLSIHVDPVDMIPHIKQCAPNQIGTNWVLGHGHSIRRMLKHIEDGGKSPRLLLDEAIPDKPAIMMETTSHSVWVNTLALKEAGIDENTENRPGGVIMREYDSDIPNGILFENEGNMIMEKALKTVSIDLKYQGLKVALSEISKNGFTSICDARLYWRRGHIEAWNRACMNGDIQLRVISGLWAYPHLNDEDQIKKLKELYTDTNPDCHHFRSQIKIYSDGLLESTTAKLFDDYKVNLHLPGITGNKGMNYFDEDRLTKYITSLQSFKQNGLGFDFHIHVIGDSAVHEALNAIERAQQVLDPSIPERNRPRHRLTHVELVNLADYGRFKTLKVVADFQVAGTFTLPFYRPKIEKLVGTTRAKNFVPVRDITETGAVTTFSSDWDVSGLNPFVGIQHATERDPQSVSVKQAIEMYTINPAYVMRQEDHVGSLTVGKFADLVIVNQDILNIPTSEIGFTKVLQTVLNGKITYVDEAEGPEDVTQYVL